MFLDPDVPLSRTPTLLVRDVGKRRDYATHASFRLMCFQIAIPSSNISARSVRKRSPVVKKTCHSRNSSISEKCQYGKRRGAWLQWMLFPFAFFIEFNDEVDVCACAIGI